jgi:hypothetical protein
LPGPRGIAAEMRSNPVLSESVCNKHWKEYDPERNRSGFKVNKSWSCVEIFDDFCGGSTRESDPPGRCPHRLEHALFTTMYKPGFVERWRARFSRWFSRKD